LGDSLWRKRSQRPSQCLPLWQQHGPENHDIISETGHLKTFQSREDAASMGAHRVEVVRLRCSGFTMLHPLRPPLIGLYPGNPHPLLSSLSYESCRDWENEFSYTIEKGGDLLLEEMPLEGTEELFGLGEGQPEMLDALMVLVEGEDIG